MGIALARRLGAEIVSLDSMTIYRGMDIGTAKPTAAERASRAAPFARHRRPGRRVQRRAVRRRRGRDGGATIRARGREVLFVGGTPLYLKSLLRGLFDGPPADWELRDEIEEELEQVGQAALHERLMQVDPVAASNIHPHDTRRMIRALEVFRATGEPLSHQQMQFDDGRPADECRVFVLRRERAELHRRIEGRVEAMIDVGLVDEVRRLDGGRPASWAGRASQAVGYREALAFLAGEIDRDEMLDADESPHAAVRQAAGHVVPQPLRVPVRRHRGRGGRGRGGRANRRGGGVKGTSPQMTSMEADGNASETTYLRTSAPSVDNPKFSRPGIKTCLSGEHPLD